MACHRPLSVCDTHRRVDPSGICKADQALTLGPLLLWPWLEDVSKEEETRAAKTSPVSFEPPVK